MSRKKLASSDSDESAVPSGVQVEPSKTTSDAAESKAMGFHVDDWFYQLTNADGQPVTGKDYQVMENVAPAGPDVLTSNGEWPWIGGSEIKDQVGSNGSSMVFQTFDVKYEGTTYSLPQEFVHEVNVGNDGTFSTRVFQIAPDLPAQPL
jgi:hypothetical protein